MNDVDRYGILKWKTKSNLQVDKLLIFQDILYENNLDDLLYRVRRYNLRLEELIKIQTKIIEHSEGI